jgi:predicted transcriptional regulator
MPRTLAAEARASETITIRLTREQKRLLERIAFATGTTATGVLRRHIRERSRELGLVTPDGVDAAIETPARGRTRVSEPRAAADAPADAARPATFGDLLERYRAAFVDRGEGARRELEETIAFVSEPVGASASPALARDLPLAELTPARLAAVREVVRTSGPRLSRKNLHLTYLRMMMNFALKQKEIQAELDPGEELRAFTAVEAGESWLPPPSEVR